MLANNDLGNDTYALRCTPALRLFIMIGCLEKGTHNLDQFAQRRTYAHSLATQQPLNADFYGLPRCFPGFEKLIDSIQTERLIFLQLFAGGPFYRLQRAIFTSLSTLAVGSGFLFSVLRFQPLIAEETLEV